MERKIPSFLLVHKGVTYIVIGEVYAQPMMRRHGSLIKKPRRLG